MIEWTNEQKEAINLLRDFLRKVGIRSCKSRILSFKLADDLT